MPFPAFLLGLIDGLNPCNLSVTALLVLTAYTSGLSRSKTASIAAAFLASQALTYLLLGLGILGGLGAIRETLELPQHLVTKATAAAMLAVGSAVFASSLYPGELKLPQPTLPLSKRLLEKTLHSAGLASAAAAGLALALHSIPCSCTGPVYLTFLSRVSDYGFKAAELLAYIALYVTPSTIILLAALNRRTYRYALTLLSNRRIVRTVLGSLMVSAAIVILLEFS